MPRVPVAVLLFLFVGCIGQPPAAAVPAPTANPAGALPTAATSPLFASEPTKLGEGIYAFVAPEPRSGLVTGNSLLVIGSDGALVVDTGHFPSLARAQIAAIRRLTAQPVRYVVTTHWHPDHLFGNEAYREAFPGVVFLGHAETRRLALEHDYEYIQQQRSFGELLIQLRTMAKTGTDDGKPLGADDRASLGPTIEAVAQTLGDAQVSLVPPSETFTAGVTLHLGRREVRVLHLGRGNTAGDVVVHVPDARLVATGDLVVNPTPYGFGSYPAEWVATLRKLLALDATTLVAGHGPVEHDDSYVQALIDLIEDVRSQVAAAVHDGASLEETRGRVKLDGWQARFAGQDAGRALAFRTGFVEPFVQRAFEEAKGKLEPE